MKWKENGGCRWRWAQSGTMEPDRQRLKLLGVNNRALQKRKSLALAQKIEEREKDGPALEFASFFISLVSYPCFQCFCVVCVRDVVIQTVFSRSVVVLLERIPHKHKKIGVTCHTERTDITICGNFEASHIHHTSSQVQVVRPSVRFPSFIKLQCQLANVNTFKTQHPLFHTVHSFAINNYTTNKLGFPG